MIDAWLCFCYVVVHNRSYYFYMKKLEDMNDTELYELLVHFDLLDLATKLVDANITGQQFLGLEDYLNKFKRFGLYGANPDFTNVNPTMAGQQHHHQNDDEPTVYDMAQLLSLRKLIEKVDNARDHNPKHLELFKEFVLCMDDLNDKLYDRRIVPVSKHGLGTHNIPPALWELVNDHLNIWCQEHLLKLWRMIAHERKLNTKPNSLSSIKQEFLLDFVAFYMNTDHAVTLMSQMLINWARGENKHQARASGFGAQYELHLLLSGFIRGSRNPISAALQTAQFLEESIKIFPEIEDEIKLLSIKCQQNAVYVLNDIHSNRLAFIALESNCALDIALESNLNYFISSDKVILLRHAMWTRSSVQLLTEPNIEYFKDVSQSSELALWMDSLFGHYWSIVANVNIFNLNITLQYIKDLLLFSKYQMTWFFSPIGKLQIELFVYFAYCVMLLYVAVEQQCDVFADGVLIELWFWICNFSFVFAEIRSLAIIGFRQYWQDRANWIDAIVDLLYIYLFILRVIGLFATGIGKDIGWLGYSDYGDVSECANSDQCINHWLNVLYFSGFFALIFAVVCRIAYLLLVFYKMGFLVKSLMEMTADIVNFLVLVFIWMIAFGFGMFLGMFGILDTTYGSPGQAIRTLGYAIMGEYLFYLFVLSFSACVCCVKKKCRVCYHVTYFLL